MTIEIHVVLKHYFSLQVLVEYDDVEWQRREWISVYKDGLFHLFMIEQTLVWAHRRDPYTNAHSTALWPALTFTALVSSVDLPNHLQPVEFLVDRELAFKDYKQLKPYLVSSTFRIVCYVSLFQITDDNDNIRASFVLLMNVTKICISFLA
ncbi:unnamed protein product [Acanthoscelides obtectus]|uniref:Lysine-specific demethylase 3B PWWP domain-containing protein n=1 Tax=Acanthoscelides obtectus TaxID=200917 RepID=A0A9P0L448_ACAOB|nr:unnamed protein product [Acanthoscelides obtectus]CAK1630541.1 Probable JmjC domain-containing histone demethylation protein 2C [Acanthoscelides obtectus]